MNNKNNMLKRAWFEIFFFLVFPWLMLFHTLQAMILVIIECFKIYPNEIHNLIRDVVYGNEEEDS